MLLPTARGHVRCLMHGAGRQDAGSQALRGVEQRAGRLALSHFRRVKQLGTGDVGLVDLVELQQGGSRCEILRVGLAQGLVGCVMGNLDDLQQGG